VVSHNHKYGSVPFEYNRDVIQHAYKRFVGGRVRQTASEREQWPTRDKEPLPTATVTNHHRYRLETIIEAQSNGHDAPSSIDDRNYAPLPTRFGGKHGGRRLLIEAASGFFTTLAPAALSSPGTPFSDVFKGSDLLEPFSQVRPTRYARIPIS
jgi:hypothetical protein